MKSNKDRFVFGWACAIALAASPCTASAAGRTFDVANLTQWQSATAAAVQGDTIVLQPSVNGLTLTLGWKQPSSYPSSGTCEANPSYCLTITGLSGKQTVFTSGGLVINRPNVVVKNLKFRTSDLDTVPVKVMNAAGQKLSNVRLTDLILEDLGPVAMDTARVHYGIFVGTTALAGVDFPVTDIRIDSSYFNRVNYAIVMRIDSFVEGVRIDHNFFSDAVNCQANGCDAIHLGGSPRNGVEPTMGAQVDHNKFIRMKGESELISSKTSANRFFDNLIVEPHGAISFRAGKGSVANRNVVIEPDSNPFRPVGANHVIRDNVMVLDANASPLILFYGTKTLYPGHMDGTKCIENPEGKWTGSYAAIESLVILGNWYASKVPLPVFGIRKDIVCGCDPQTQTPIDCPVAPGVRLQSGNSNLPFTAPEVTALVNGSDDYCAVFRPDSKKPASAWNGRFAVIGCADLEYTTVNGRKRAEDYVNLGKKNRMFPL